MGGDILSWVEIARAIVIAAVTAGIVLLAAPYLKAPPAPVLPILFFAVLMAVAMTGPIALLEKYRNWCGSSAECAYIDSRYAGWAVMLGLGLVLQWSLRRAGKVTVALVVGLLSGVTAVQNALVATEMRAVLAPWEVAEQRVCAGGDAWPEFVASDLAQSISFHETPDRTRFDYWQAWAAQVGCEVGPD